ncbi:MAG TPA: hypothetical protein VF141_20950, partial [Chryseolinea sp.]
EAMSSGVLVCGTKVGLMYDEPSCCVTVDVKDHVALANQTLEILRDHVSHRRITQSAQQWANTHSINWTVRQLSELYKT